MRFDTPSWLLALSIVTGVWWQLRRRRHASTRVPHIDLWRSQVVPTRQSTRTQPLPLTWKFLLIAAACAIVAAARPVVSRSPKLRIVSPASDADRLELQRRVDIILSRSNIRTSVVWERPASNVPSNEPFDRNSLRASSVTNVLSEKDTILIDDRAEPIDSRHLQLSPPFAVSITQIAIARRPLQVMIRVQNASHQKTATLRITTTGVTQTAIRLPEAGASENLFVDLAEIPKAISAQLFDDANQALCKPCVWRPSMAAARLTEIAPIHSALQRFAEAYDALHPAIANSPTILIGANLPGGQMGILAASTPDELLHPTVTQAVHAVLAHTDLTVLNANPLRVSAKPEQSWQVIARANQRPILAVRELPVRQVWFGFDAPSFASHEAFVILMADMIDWISAGNDVSGRLDDTPSGAITISDAAIEDAIGAAVPPQRSALTTATMASVAILLMAAIVRHQACRKTA